MPHSLFSTTRRSVFSGPTGPTGLNPSPESPVPDASSRHAESVETLRGCLQCTDWQAFGDPCQNTEEYTYAVTSYIHFCEEVSVSPRRVKVFPNNQPWFTPSLHAKLMSREEAFNSGDCASDTKAKHDAERALWDAKISHKKRTCRLVGLAVSFQSQEEECCCPRRRLQARGRVLLSQTTTPG